MEDNILIKSTKNLEAAKYIIDKTDFFCSSVHCSYYSVFQFMKYFLNTKFNIDYDEQKELYNKHCSECKTNNTKSKGSHEFLIILCKNIIKSKDVVKANIFEKNIMGLKNIRHQSDYDDIIIDKIIANKAYNKADSIIKIINTIKQ